jgi:hypothetical protein
VTTARRHDCAYDADGNCISCGADAFGDYDADYDLDEQDCSWCSGDGYAECDDPLQCCARHVNGMCPCGACGGTGLRKNQVVF